MSSDEIFKILQHQLVGPSDGDNQASRIGIIPNEEWQLAGCNLWKVDEGFDARFCFEKQNAKPICFSMGFFEE